MKRIVVDASVAVKWYLPEPFSAQAALWYQAARELSAPDIFHAEFVNAIWKRIRIGELETGIAGRIVDAIGRMPIVIIESRALAGDALRIAVGLGLTVYDSLYIASARAMECPLVTADRELFKKTRRGPLLGDVVRWIEDVPGK